MPSSRRWWPSPSCSTSSTAPCASPRATADGRAWPAPRSPSIIPARPGPRWPSPPAASGRGRRPVELRPRGAAGGGGPARSHGEQRRSCSPEPLAPIPSRTGGPRRRPAVDERRRSTSSSPPSPTRPGCCSATGSGSPSPTTTKVVTTPSRSRSEALEALAGHRPTAHRAPQHRRRRSGSGAEEAWEAVERRRGAVPPLRLRRRRPRRGPSTRRGLRRRASARSSATCPTIPARCPSTSTFPSPVGASATRVAGCGRRRLRRPRRHRHRRRGSSRRTTSRPGSGSPPSPPATPAGRGRPSPSPVTAPPAATRPTVKVVRVNLLDPGRAVEVLALRRRPAPPGPVRRRARVSRDHPRALVRRDSGQGPHRLGRSFDGEATDRWVLTAVGSDFDACSPCPCGPTRRGRAGPVGRSPRVVGRPDLGRVRGHHRRLASGDAGADRRAVGGPS